VILEKTVKLSSIRPNPNNPRVIRDIKFQRLVESIKRDPEFLEKRGIVVADGIILGGNQRYRAVSEAMKDDAFRGGLGLKSKSDIPSAWVQDASAWPEEKRRRFIIVDNADGYGEWDYEILANQYDDLPLVDWGVDIPKSWGAPQEGVGGGEPLEQEIEKPQIIACPKCGHEFSVMRENNETKRKQGKK